MYGIKRVKPSGGCDGVHCWCLLVSVSHTKTRYTHYHQYCWSGKLSTHCSKAPHEQCPARLHPKLCPVCIIYMSALLCMLTLPILTDGASLGKVDRQVEQQNLAQVVPHTTALTHSCHNLQTAKIHRCSSAPRRHHHCSTEAQLHSLNVELPSRVVVAAACMRTLTQPVQACSACHSAANTHGRACITAKQGGNYKEEQTVVCCIPLRSCHQPAPSSLPPLTRQYQ